MPLRGATPVVWRPHSVSDAVDGTNAPPGAMNALRNVIPDPNTADVFVPRPAATTKIDFTGGVFSSPGFISSMIVIGDLVYGTLATARFAGKDEPFVYSLASTAFTVLAGVSATNVPNQPPTTGDWTPPVVAQVGGRVIVCHPGFSAGAVKFGWFDISGFTETTIGNSHAGSTLIDGNPSILGVQPGMTMGDGTNVPFNDPVVSTALFTLTTTGNTHSSTTLDGLASTTGVAVGQPIAGSGIPSGTTVATIVSSTSVTMSQAATSTLTGVSVTFTGATITLGTAANTAVNNLSLTIVGGTPNAPLWGAGDTDRNNLSAQPLGVAQFNGRAYFALGTKGIQYSDSGLPCRITNATATQALTTNDGLAVTAIGQLGLGTAVSGGIVQALIAFEGTTKMQQITGDPATGNLSMNLLPVATGTLAPLSITPTELGLAFVGPQGLRFIGFNGTVSPIVGEAGAGIANPFIFAVAPSRIAAAASVDVLRISVQNGAKAGNPQEEYWYDMVRHVWTGPHTSAADQIALWRATFLLSLKGVNAKLWESDAQPSSSSTYVENGTQLLYLYEPVLLPDNRQRAMNAVVEMSMAFMPATVGGDIKSPQIAAFDETAVVANRLDLVDIVATDSAFRQRAINWTKPLVFKQAFFQVSGACAAGVRLGNLYLTYQILGYQLPGTIQDFLLANDGTTILVDDSTIPILLTPH